MTSGKANIQNIYQLFRAQTAQRRGEAVFYSRKNGCWQRQNWEDLERRVEDFACALLAQNLTRGASVAILAGNLPEWTIVDLAAIAAGGVGVGIYPTSSPQQCEYILNHSDAEIVFVDTPQQLAKILQIKNKLTKVKRIIIFEANDKHQQPFLQYSSPLNRENLIVSYGDFLDAGSQNRQEFLPRVAAIGESLKPADTAIMVYTSGTTGEPKGAMLSHRYVLNSCESLRQSVPIFETDVLLSYLPACHVAERISGIYNRLYNGAPCYFVDDLAKLHEYLLEVKPTVFASVPRFFEKIYAAVIARHGRDATAQTLQDAFGGRIRLLTSGGAALPEEIAAFFAARDLPILQAYGLTENICVAFNTKENLKFGTVGKPMPMCQIKIAMDGEVLVKSEMMFSGYYKAAEQTAAMFDAEGWLKTGDLGSLDSERFLTITGRKKEIIVLSNGKNVAPALLENLLKENHLISQALIYGDGRNYLVALITLNQTEAEAFARERGIKFADFAELTQKTEIQTQIAAQIEKTNARVSTSEQIKRFRILERDFTVAEDEITPTLKLKRAVVSNKFRDVLESLYETYSTERK
jgi:long-chain acyl-CoA synthetase